ncbi:MAG: hypothetical protein M1554_00150 [Patescibacteria group bacterium]|jgi:hypothetical protein|nr:hypothetical protein [Patescibacteria group bacterium]
MLDSNQNNEIYSSTINLVEQLKLPFIQILKQLELSSINNQYSNLRNIEISAEYAIKLIDNYILSLKIENKLIDVYPETFLVSSVLYNSVQYLESLAKMYGVDLKILIDNKSAPVTGNRIILETAILSLGMSLVEAVALNSKPILYFATHKSRYGVVAGVYTDEIKISSKLLREGRKFKGKSSQPLQSMLYSPGAGIFIADNLFNSLKLNILISKHKNLYGLGTILSCSKQLTLV